MSAAAATARAEAREPRVVEKTGTIQITATTSGRVIPAAAVVVYIAVEPPHGHLHAKHDDPVMLGTELGLLLVVLFVGWRLVACRLLIGDSATRGA
jgi:hypothetical protein